jgi:hypothetical protein
MPQKPMMRGRLVSQLRPLEVRAEQEDGHTQLGDAVGNGQPRVAESGQSIGWLPLSAPAASMSKPASAGPNPPPDGPMTL